MFNHVAYKKSYFFINILSSSKCRIQNKVYYACVVAIPLLMSKRADYASESERSPRGGHSNSRRGMLRLIRRGYDHTEGYCIKDKNRKCCGNATTSFLGFSISLKKTALL